MTARPKVRVKNTSLLGPHLKSDQGEHKSQPEDFNSPQVLTQLKLCFNEKQLIKTKIMKILKQLKKIFVETLAYLTNKVLLTCQPQ